MNNAHLGLLSSSYPRFEGDLAGSFVRRSALDLVARGHRVTVLAPADPRVRRVPLADPIEVLEFGVPAGVFYGQGAPESFERSPLTWLSKAPLALLAFGWAARRALRDCDALLAHWLAPAGMVASLVAEGRPVAMIEHSSAARLALRLGTLGEQSLRALLSQACFVGASEAGLAGTLAGLSPVGAYWMGARANVDALFSLPVPCPQRPLRLGFLGRRVPLKGLEVLLQAFAEARREADLRLLVGGPGERLHQAGVEDRGELVGSRAIAQFFGDIDVLVIPSRHLGGRREGLPCVLQEAWAAARPVLASGLTGPSQKYRENPSELLRIMKKAPSPLYKRSSLEAAPAESAGVLLERSWRFEAGDVGGLAHRLRWLARHPEQARVEGERGRTRLRSLLALWGRAETTMLQRLGVSPGSASPLGSEEHAVSA